MAVLTPAQVRLLSFLNRYPVWHLIGELQLVRMLEDGDAAEADNLVGAGLAIQKQDMVRISPAGQVKAEAEGQVPNDADRLKEMLSSGIMFHLPCGEDS